MANPTFNNGDILSYEAGEAIAAHRFVKDKGDNTYLYATAGGGVDGVSKAAAAIGEELAVVIDGVPLVEAAEALDPGDEVASDTDGKAVKYVSGTKAGRVTNNTSATTDGDLVAVRLYGEGHSDQGSGS